MVERMGVIDDALAQIDRQLALLAARPSPSSRQSSAPSATPSRQSGSDRPETDILHRPRLASIVKPTMPRLSEFYGIVIAMYYAEHGVAHFHARYAEWEATIAIATLEILAGSLPDRALRLVREWAILHREELEADWRRARASEPLEPIAPLP